MAEFKRPTNREEFDQNFGQIKPLMNATMAYYESSRCLFCYDAPCITACPTGIDIPLFIRQINTNNVKGAAKTIYEKNYLGNACGKVCPTEVLCEGACVYNEQDVKPIEIGRLQNFATASVIEANQNIFHKEEKREEKVAVIGAGPAGISCACELSSLGYQVDVFEAKSQSGGLALYGTAPYKILNAEVTDEIDYLQRQFGFKIHYNKEISTEEDISRLDLEYKAVFLGIGLGGTRSLDIAGQDLQNVVGATEFIEKLKTDPMGTLVGRKVIVVGGGNTAMDAASESARMGADEVTLIYRRGRDKMRAYDFELELAVSVGARPLFEMQPVKINGNGKVESLTCVRTQTSSDGQLKLVEGSEINLDCDMLILATGQEKKRSFLDLLQVEYDQGGKIKVHDGSFQTSNPRYFAGGDAYNGGAEVVNACAEGKAAAQSIHSFLQNQ